MPREWAPYYRTMESERDYYSILHVQPDAPLEIIRSSYRTLMQRLKRHPDLGGDQATAVLINGAYATLTDPVKRAEYDRQLVAQRAGTRTGARGHAERPQRDKPRSDSPCYETSARDRCLFCKSRYSRRLQPDTVCSKCESPLYPAAKHRLEESDRRAAKRISKYHSIAFYTRWPQAKCYSGQSRDISLNGLQFATHCALEREQILKIACDTCSAVARVVTCRQDQNSFTPLWVVRVEFITLRFEHSRGTFVSARV